MTHVIPGIHHVTAICGSPQPNVDFYTGPLNQRLVKKTVNFDAPDVYHLYYGDHVGKPGTLVTFFAFADAAPGRVGPGTASAVAYRVASGWLDAWKERLARDAVVFEEPAARFAERLITVADPDGLQIEFIEVRGSTPSELTPQDDGLHSVTLCLSDPAPTARLLTDLFGYQAAGHETSGDTERLRFRSPSGARGAIVDLLSADAGAVGRQGAGSIHHVAFRAETPERQRQWRERIAALGLEPTPVIDRQYFKSIYFREPGGVLFEIATDAPGFATDEAVETLGTQLKLPPQHELRRARIERTLPPIRSPS